MEVFVAHSVQNYVNWVSALGLTDDENLGTNQLDSPTNMR